MSSSIDPADDLQGIRAALLTHESLGQFERLEQGGSRGNCFVFPSDAPKVFVKYNMNSHLIQQQAAAQSFIYENLRCPGFQVPKVFRVHNFPGEEMQKMGYSRSEDKPWSILVMEYIDARTLQKAFQKHEETPIGEILLSRIVDAIVALAALHQSPDRRGIPERAGGGRISSKAWGPTCPRATREFASVKDLERYINEKIQNLPGSKPINFTDEPLLLSHGDISLHNFLIDNIDDPQSQMTVIDFDFTNWLPASFLFWELDTFVRGDEEYTAVYELVEEKLKSTPLKKKNIMAIRYFRWKMEKDAY